MRYLHTMLRVHDLDAALKFFVDDLGLVVTRRHDNEAARYSLVFLSTGAEGDPAEIELTYNWDEPEPYATGRFFGHLAFAVNFTWMLLRPKADASTAPTLFQNPPEMEVTR